MFFVAIGVVIGAPHIINGFNRILEEIVIPRQDMRKLQERRAAQAALGIEEDKREVFHHVQILANGRELIAAELTNEELKQVENIGAINIIKRACNRRPHVKKIDEYQESA